MQTKILNSILATVALLAGDAQASYFDLTKGTPEAQQCITCDARYPYWTDHIYIATYPGHSRSKEGWMAAYYGGIIKVQAHLNPAITLKPDPCAFLRGTRSFPSPGC